MFKRNDLVLAAILIAAALCVIVITGRRPQPSAGAVVRITQDGAVVYTLPLDQPAQFTVRSADGGENHVEIGDGACRVTEADCPDGICVKRGRISRNGETIVCLPHKLVIEVVGGQEAEVDTVAR